ncbi:MAG: M13 family metallopeptidase [Myxococcales bacterium]
MKPRSLLYFSAALAACASARQSTSSAPAPAESARAKPRIGSFGVDLAGGDPSVRPGQDFYLHAGGQWLKTNQIPADRARWGMFDVLREEADANVHTLLEEQALKKEPAGSNGQKTGDFYRSFLDVAAIDAKGFAPAAAGLSAIDAARTLEDVARLIGRADLGLPSPIVASVGLDQKNPDRWVPVISHGGLGLPEREYYLKTEAQFEQIRASYKAHLEKVLLLGGSKRAAAGAAEILALETKIAGLHWPIADRRERDKTYNLRTPDQLQVEAPAFPWKAYLASWGSGDQRELIVRESTAIPKLAALFAATPVEVWKTYLSYHYLKGMAEVLPSQLDAEVFDFYGRILNGQPQQRERWKRAVAAVNGALGEAVGEVYVARFFKPKAKVEMDKLVANLRKGYAARIESVDWMTPETKKVALEKLAAFRPKIGYPAKWKDYSKLDVVPGDAFGNAVRAEVWVRQDRLAKLKKPSDRDEWFMTPQTVNAYYNSTFNEIVFPAAILQPPFFDADADPAVNYGGIGGVIGHEMGHGFDDQGAKSDAKGILRTWWGTADLEAFKKRTDALAAQYSLFEPQPGLHINGRLTLGENIGDVGGLTVAYKAYELSRGGQPAPQVDGFSGDQRFFLGWAQVWRTLSRDQALRNQVLTDPHSPGRYRANGVVRNLDAWYTAFDVQPTDALYLAPEQRVRIW